MVEVIDYRFQGHKTSAIPFDDETLKYLKECFLKFLPQDKDKRQAEKLNPTFL